jgi:hypothetical protein
MRSQTSQESPVDQLGAEFGALLIERVAPEEGGLYPEIIESYKESAAKGGKKAVEQPLALGVGEIVGIMSPLVYEAGKIVVGYMLNLAKDAAAPRILLWFKSRFSEPAPVELDLLKIDEIVAEVRDKMGKRGVEPVLNEKIAEAVRGLLQQSPPHDGK